MTKCLQCNTIIAQTEGKRAKLYCSDACRKAYQRALTDRVDDSLPDKPLPDTTLKALTDKQPIKAQQGICHGCGKVVKDYICICYNCTHSGVTHKSLGIDISKCDY